MASGQNPAFAQVAAPVSIAASTTAAGGTLSGAGDTALVTNPTSAIAWVSFSGAASVGSGYPVLPGTQRAIGISPLVAAVSVILSTGSETIYIEVGSGAAH